MNDKIVVVMVCVALGFALIVPIIVPQSKANPSVPLPPNPLPLPLLPNSNGNASAFASFIVNPPNTLIVKSFDNASGIFSMTVLPVTVNSVVQVLGNLILRNTSTLQYTTLEQDMEYTSVNGHLIKAVLCVETTPVGVHLDCPALQYQALANTSVIITTTGNYVGKYTISFSFIQLSSSVNPYTQVLPTPALSTSVVTDTFPGHLQVYIIIGTSGTEVLKDGVIILPAVAGRPTTVTVNLHTGETLQLLLNPTLAGVSWVWWHD